MSILESTAPVLLEGGLGVDDRGVVAFANHFSFDGVKRFYIVSNHRQGFIRAWHGHKREAKYVTAVHGISLVCAVKVDNWDDPAKDAKIYRHVLSSEKPTVLFIPAGFANGFMSLSQDAKLIFFSTSTVDESRSDDIRFDAHYWDPWTVIER